MTTFIKLFTSFDLANLTFVIVIESFDFSFDCLLPLRVKSLPFPSLPFPSLSLPSWMVFPLELGTSPCWQWLQLNSLFLEMK